MQTLSGALILGKLLSLGLDSSWTHVGQKTSMIGLAAILALMDWDLLTSLVSQAPTQATLEAGDWKLVKKKTRQITTNKPFKTFQWYEEAIARATNCFEICLVKIICKDYVSSYQSLSCEMSTFYSFCHSDRGK